MKAVLERPYGCAEQTISSTYASLLYLELATAAKAESPEKEKAQSFLQLGYERLLGYFNTGGGLTYWGGNDTTGDAALTAYGVEFLTEAEPFVSVDRSRIAGAIQWLLSQQSADGSWRPRYGAVSARRDALHRQRPPNCNRGQGLFDLHAGWSSGTCEAGGCQGQCLRRDIRAGAA